MKNEAPRKPSPRAEASAGRDDARSEHEDAAVIAAIRTVRFGTVEVIIHDGNVVQVNRTEKIRIER